MNFSRAIFCFLLLTLRIFAAEPDGKSHIIFLVGDSEYQTSETVPAWAKAEVEPKGIRCTFLIDDPKKPFDFPQLAELKNADAFFVCIRRRGIPPAQLAAIRAFAESGKPVIGMRTGSHAFAPKTLAPGEAEWPTFDRDILGGWYQNHYGKGPATIVRIAPAAAEHPILRGLLATEMRFESHLYKCRELAATTTVLLSGVVDGMPDAKEPVAWLNIGEKRKAFYTSLGSPEDFAKADFRRLLTNATLWMVGK
jgi:type 1 glutamine amidotransferase